MYEDFSNELGAPGGDSISYLECIIQNNVYSENVFSSILVYTNVAISQMKKSKQVDRLFS